jgi:hypothetical protein
LVKINQRRRAGVAGVPAEDAWSLESLSRGGGRALPRLRWARRDPNSLTQPAHLAIAFDSFTSQVAAEEKGSVTSPILAYGLAANLQRVFSIQDSQPCWRLFVPLDQDGLKLPNRVVTERLQKLQNIIASAVSRWAGVENGQPLIRTIPSGDDVEMLDTLHRLCDWVVTVDRNAGVEYFDSPKASPAVYDAYLIDAVPERDDLGCLQMITSTAHFDEVRHLLDQTLALMGLSGSMRNCEYLLGQLKGLSGRLAMRLAAGGDDLPATRLRSAHAEEQYRIRSNLRRSHEDAEIFTSRLANLRQDLGVRQDTSGDKFRIEFDGQESNNRGIAGELILRRAEKLKARFGEDVRLGKFAGFDLFMRPSFNNTTEMVLRGQNSYGARVTDTALGTIRSLEATVQGFEERAERLELDITDANKRIKELGEKVGAKFEREERFQELTRRQSEIEEKLDLTKNQAPSQAEAAENTQSEAVIEKIEPVQRRATKHKQGVTV